MVSVLFSVSFSNGWLPWIIIIMNNDKSSRDYIWKLLFEERKILDEGIKDTLKNIGLGALLSVSLSGPAQALDNIKMDDLLKMGMTSSQASEIIKMPAQAKGEVVQRFEKQADDPKVTKQVEKIKSANTVSNSSPPTKKDTFKPVLGKDGYYAEVDPEFKKNPFDSFFFWF